MSVGAIGIAFDGVENPIACSYTLSHGIEPSVAILDMIPQYDQIAYDGTLTLGDGFNSVSFPGCRVDFPTLRRTQQGFILTLKILDRRWKWRYGEVSGHYNIRNPDNTIDPSTQKTPQQLAGLLLDAMGESGYSVTDLPNQTNPEVEWVSDNPAEELQELAGNLGCRVVLQLDNTVALRVEGSGNSLPDDPTQQAASYGVDFAERPDTVKFVSGATRFQTRFALEAVGRETTGEIKAIADLSYAPPGGWSGTDPYVVLSGIADPDTRAAAQETVYKWYRIKNTGVIAPGYNDSIRGNPSLTLQLKDILPVDDFLVDTMTDADGVSRPKKAYIQGKFWAEDFAKPQNETIPYATVGKEKSWSFDRDRGIVQFSDWIVQFDASNGNKTLPAELYLFCSHCVRDSTHLLVRKTKSQNVPGSTANTGPSVVRMDEIVPTSKGTYSSSTGALTDVIKNDSDINPEIDFYLSAAVAQFADTVTDDRPYAAIMSINPDGAIQQVTWEVGPNGAMTRATVNTEHAMHVPSYEDLKRIRDQSRQKRIIGTNTIKKLRNSPTAPGFFG